MEPSKTNPIRKNPFVFGLIFVNIAVFLVLSLLGDTEDSAFMLRHGAMYYPLLLEGQYWRLLSAMFLHFGISHLATNMLSLYAIGSVIETAFGWKRFLFIYFGSGIGSGLISALYRFLAEDPAVCAGASGAIFGLSGALICLALFKQTERYGISSKRVLPAVVVSLVLSASTSTDNAAHAGGLVLGFLISLFLVFAGRKQNA